MTVLDYNRDPQGMPNRYGMGGTVIPQNPQATPMGRMSGMAMMTSPTYAPQLMSPNPQHNINGYNQVSPGQILDRRGPAGMEQANYTPPQPMRPSTTQDTGVRPGVYNGPNAVQQARMQQPPSQYAGAALNGYMHGR